MDKRKHPMYNPQDSLNSVVSSFEMTGIVPAAPGTEPESENYAALAGIPIQSQEAAKRYRRKKDANISN